MYNTSDSILTGESEIGGRKLTAAGKLTRKVQKHIKDQRDRNKLRRLEARLDKIILFQK